MSLKKIENPDAFRSNIRKKLSSFLQENMTHAANLEKGIYNRTLEKADEMNIVKKWNCAHFNRVN